MRILLSIIISLFIVNIIVSQNKYNGIDTDCDNNLMPASGIYKIQKDTSFYETKISSSNITLPCDVYYQIKLKQKEFETVIWKTNGVIITIYPKKNIETENPIMNKNN
ncbi:MAG: hypothetical protein OHK0036_03940 [Bacteroidia bacterium]